MDHARPELKYVAVADLDGSAKKLDGVDVVGLDGEKLGTVEGFIIDTRGDQPRHVVVRAGWFIHKHFLLPIGHVSLAGDSATLVADTTKKHVSNFPGFDKDEFGRLDADAAAFTDASIAAVLDGGNPAGVDHYRVPGWWPSDFYRTKSDVRQ